jgi:hypothetical protein
VVASIAKACAVANAIFFCTSWNSASGISPASIHRKAPEYDELSPSQDLLEKLYREKISVRGSVQAPPGFSGPIFIGLFRHRIPEGTPVACAINMGPGEFVMKAVPPGHYYLFALGLLTLSRLDDFFRCENSLRGGGQRLVLKNEPIECGQIVLRELELTDPPVLLNLPALLRKRESQSRSIA